MRLRDLPKLLMKAEKTAQDLKALADRTMGKIPSKKKKKNPYTHAE